MPTWLLVVAFSYKWLSGNCVQMSFGCWNSLFVYPSALCFEIRVLFLGLISCETLPSGHSVEFKIRSRWGSRARLNALLTIAACRDFVERVRSMCTHLSLISAPGTFVASAHLSPFFSSLHLSSIFFQCLPLTLLFFPVVILWFLRFTCSSESKCSWRKIHFSFFHFFVFMLIFLSFFLSKKSDGRRQNTSSK